MNTDLLKKWEKWFKLILGALVFIWILLTNVVILSRYVLKVSIPWSDEIFILMFIWLIFIGTALASVDNKHITITLLSEMIKSRKKKIVLDIAQNIIFLLFIVIVCYQSWVVVSLQVKSNQITAILNIPVYVTTLSMSLGSTAWAAIIIYKIFGDVSALRKGVK
ncbi:MAG: TRAP transporter small permease [Sphaerochaetaceae bacterium]|nr:TRAP transporter small permease [Sphaerochaetaceae bacterium]